MVSCHPISVALQSTTTQPKVVRTCSEKSRRVDCREYIGARGEEICRYASIHRRE